MELNEYGRVLNTLYEKSLILEDISDFHPVLRFWYFDAIGHLDYSLSELAYNAQSPRNLISRQYLKYHTDEGKCAPFNRFEPFMHWLSNHHPDRYELFPLFLQKIYSQEDPANYRSFRIVLNPDDNKPIMPDIYMIMIDEMFDPTFLPTLYNGSKTAALLDSFEYSG